MPKDYSLDKTPANQQRLPEHAQDEAWIRSFLDTALIGHVATRWDEQPFITPTTFWYDPAKHEIYFHSNIVGRVRANAGRHPKVCFETSEYGRLLPSNVALEFSIQYASVMVFGEVRLVEQPEEKSQALYGLLRKYFPEHAPGKEFRPITEKELARTSVYAIEIESWSGKKNWPDQAEQSDEWPASNV
jgi:hypothetical protein